MSFDPLLTYAFKHESVEQRLVDIFEMEKVSWTSAEVERYFTELKTYADAGSGAAMCLCARLCRGGLKLRCTGPTSIEWGQMAVGLGFAPGYFEVGCCYEIGIDVPKSLETARNWFEKSARKGYGYAATHLASGCHDGTYGDVDAIKAVEYAELGFRLGDPNAALMLGGWYEDGNGVIRNLKEAVAWYKRSCDTGGFLACERLHRAYSWGELGLSVDKGLAAKYYKDFEEFSP